MRKSELKEYAKSEHALLERKRLEKVVPMAVDAIAPAIVTVLRRTASGEDFEQIGSGVLLELNDRVYLATAAHVLEHWLQPSSEHQRNIVIYTTKGIFELTGTTWKSAPNHDKGSRRLILDVSYIEIVGPQLQYLRPGAFSRANLTTANHDDIYVMTGYPLSQTTSPQIETTIFGFCAVATGLFGVRYQDGRTVCALIGETVVDDVSQSFINYGKIIVGTALNDLPELQGMSGGAMVRLEGAPRDVTKPLPESTAIKLAAIIVERAPRFNDTPPLMCATSIHAIVAMIDGARKDEESRIAWVAGRLDG